MQMNNHNGSRRHPNRIPLPPRSEISLECLLERLDPIYYLLRQQGFNDFAALSGRDAALDHGWVLLETGQAVCMSDEHRAGRLWITALHGAASAARKKPRSVSLAYEPPDQRQATEDEEPPFIAAVRLAMEKLTVQQMDAALLHWVLGLSVRECADEMGITAATVCGHLQRALARLTKELAALRPHPFPEKPPAGASACAFLWLKRQADTPTPLPPMQG